MRIRVGVLPSLVTLGNLVCGFGAICVTAKAHIYWGAAVPDPLRGYKVFAVAGSLILLAMIFDVLDGRIARMANLTSEFGAQLDSLCDMVTFGVAPAYLVFLEASSRTEIFRHPRYAWGCAALYVICAALRLARFNVETKPDEDSHLYFRGLPSPAAAGVIASLAIFDWRSREEADWAARAMPFASIVLGMLMVSRLRYIHLIGLLFRERKPFVYLAVLVFAVFTVIAFSQHFEYVLLVGFVGYALSGPISYPWTRARRRRKAAEAAAEQGEPSSELEEMDDSIF